VAVLLIASAALVPLGLVTVKMLPFDNKSELQVVVRLPDNAPLESTARVATTLATEALKDPQVVSAQSYAGTASPYTFNGLVRHYFLRQQSNLADVQIQLTPKGSLGTEPRRRAKRCAQHSRRWPQRSARRSRWSKCHRDRRCCRRSWPRCTVPIRPSALISRGR
jgi:multidrug efflux pump subunit AcrB